MSKISVMKIVWLYSCLLNIDGYCGDIGRNTAAAAQQDLYQKREDARRSGYAVIRKDEELRNIYRENPGVEYMYVCGDAGLYRPCFCSYGKLKHIIVERGDAQTRASDPDYWTPGYGTIPPHAFENCTNLREIELPDNITSIRDSAFSKCSFLTLTALPDSVREIGCLAFRGCTSLAPAKLPAGLIKIGVCAFSGCISLAPTELPPGLISIGPYAFRHCTSLNVKELPPGLRLIDMGAFEGCCGLETMTVPSSVKNICYGAFRTTGLLMLDLSACSSVSFFDFGYRKVPHNAESILNCLFGTNEHNESGGPRSIRECICDNCVVRLPCNLGDWVFYQDDGKWHNLPNE
ncbi:MAG: leucine-rich repeat domain-containing protein [Holosporales bacterium]|jgi:hypothetical protein|nr:leucine-rich repeat domain-containing protein [Holosporales bacterium]